ncbi:MAG: nitroreductase family deazaflavin-dependent oxidoreductase [Aggregatilineales bacterium]
MGDNGIPYPSGVARSLLRFPLLLYRLGLGGLANAAHILILTTQGRTTGLPRHTPIEYRQHGSKVYVISAWGTQPHWVRNLLANPQVTIQMGRRRFSARAELIANPGEALRVLHLFRRRAPVIYDALIARMSAREKVTARTMPEVTDRFTIVRFLPLPDAGSPAPLPMNLIWVWPALLLAGTTVTVLVTLARTRRTDDDE